jgi:acyl carrier protein
MMNDADIRARLTEIFRDVFDDESIEIFDAMTAKDVEEWDSLNHINLIVAVERGFKVKFTTKEVSNLANVGEFVALIASKLS